MTDEAMRHVAELVDVTPAEVSARHRSTRCSSSSPVGKYLVNVCSTMSCALLGADELMHHAERALGVKAGAPPPTDVHARARRVHAACTEAPALQVNYRYRYRVTTDDFDELVDDLRSGRSTARSRRTARSAQSSARSRPTFGRRRRHRRRRPVPVAITSRSGSSDATGVPGTDQVLPTADRPQIVTSRFDYDDRHTLDRYARDRRLRGPAQGARHDARRGARRGQELDAARPRWRRLPRRRQVGLLPPGVWPRYLVVNGDESEPGTYKDRLLMERDPHQLIEGCLIACYAAGLRSASSTSAARWRSPTNASPHALNEAYDAGYVGKNIMGTDFSVDIVLHWGAGAYIVGEETALIESLEGERGMPRLKPPYFPAAIGLYGQPTIVNNVETLSNLPFIARTARRPSPRSAPRPRPARACSRFRATSSAPASTRSSTASTTFRDIIYGDEFCQGIRDDNDLKAFVPGGGSAPWFFAEQLDLPFEGREPAQPGRCSAPAR